MGKLEIKIQAVQQIPDSRSLSPVILPGWMNYYYFFHNLWAFVSSKWKEMPSKSVQD